MTVTANTRKANAAVNQSELSSPCNEANAIAAGKRLLIIADYDADGATACAVGVRALRAFGAKVDYLVPDRFRYGYGLTPEIVALAAEQQPQLIVTVDNGIASVEGVAHAKQLGLKVLITDHHLPGDQLPEAHHLVNPNQPGCAFASTTSSRTVFTGTPVLATSTLPVSPVSATGTKSRSGLNDSFECSTGISEWLMLASSRV